MIRKLSWTQLLASWLLGVVVIVGGCGWLKPKKVGVYISGEVHQPGLVYVEADSRVAHVVERAGGVTERADLRAVNMAEKVFEEQHIDIPAKEADRAFPSEQQSDVRQSNPAPRPEPPVEPAPSERAVDPRPSELAERADEPADPLEPEPSVEEDASLDHWQGGEIIEGEKVSLAKPSIPKSQTRKVSINRADQRGLMQIPGVGSVTAEKIIFLRQQMPGGRFARLAELKKVPGIKDKRYQKIAPWITL